MFSCGTYTATVSGTDLASNPYSGTESITFTLDTSGPTLNSSKNIKVLISKIRISSTIRKLPTVIIAANGTSCRHQIKDGTQRGLIGVSFSFLFSCTSIKNTPKVSQPPPEGMVLVPAGIYTMGGRSSQAYVDEFPKHS